MKYMLLIHQGDTPTPRDPEAWESLSEDEQKARLRRLQGDQRDPGRQPRAPAEEPETATTVRVEDGKTLTTDGPFVELKEAIGGYLLFEADDLDAAIELAARIPAARLGGAHRGAPDRGVVAILEQVFRDQWGRVLATLIGFLGDFDLAEEAAQEAFAVAAERWPRDGIPSRPACWLITTARNRAIDRIRRDRTLAEKTRLLEVPEPVEDDMDDTTFPDERLELVFTCCHPALATDAQVALTLRTLGGLTTPEIARAFLVPEATMAQRLVRAKRKIKAAGIPVPGPARPPAARPAGRGARRRLPDLQRGLRRPRRPRGRGDPARPRARRADAGRARGPRPAGADAAARRPPRRALSGRRARPARRPGPRALGRRPDRRRAARRSTGRSPCAAAARTCCRRRSPRCTRTSRATGRRSPPSTASSRGSPTRRWSS